MTKTSAAQAKSQRTTKSKPASEAASKKKPARKYSARASAEVAMEMREMKRGQLRIGNSRKKVTNPNQAIAIGLSKARRAGAKVPPNPNTGR